MSNKGKQGFASLSPEERKRVAREGGIAAHRAGKAHKWNSEEAREMGKLGGKRGKGKVKPRALRFKEEL